MRLSTSNPVSVDQEADNGPSIWFAQSWTVLSRVRVPHSLGSGPLSWFAGRRRVVSWRRDAHVPGNGPLNSLKDSTKLRSWVNVVHWGSLPLKGLHDMTRLCKFSRPSHSLLNSPLALLKASSRVCRVVMLPKGRKTFFLESRRLLRVRALRSRSSIQDLGSTSFSGSSDSSKVCKPGKVLSQPCSKSTPARQRVELDAREGIRKMDRNVLAKSKRDNSLQFRHLVQAILPSNYIGNRCIQAHANKNHVAIQEW